MAEEKPRRARRFDGQIGSTIIAWLVRPELRWKPVFWAKSYSHQRAMGLDGN